MEDEVIDKTDPTESDDQQTVDDSAQDNRPDDPTEAVAFFEKKLEDERKAKADLKAANKKLKEEVEQERTGKRTWYDATQRAESELAQLKTNGKKQPVDDDVNEFADLDLGELSTSDDGMKRLESAIDRRVERRARQIADEISSKKIESTLSDMGQYGKITNQFPDLSDEKGEFYQRFTQEVTRLKNDPAYNGLTATQLSEFAATRVESEFLREGKKRTSTEQNRERLRNAQPGGGTRPGGGSKPVVITDEDRREAKRMNGGVDVPADSPFWNQYKARKAEAAQARR